MSQINPKEEMNPFERFMAFIKANEKVFWVLLLAFLGFSFAFGTQIASVMGPSGQRVSVGFEEELSALEFDAETRALRNTLMMSGALFLIEPFFPTQPAQPKYKTIYPGGRALTYREFRMFRQAAEDLGLKVSQAEFEAARNELWKISYAQEKSSDLNWLGKLGVEMPTGQFDFAFIQATKAEKKRLLDELNKKPIFEKMRNRLRSRFINLLERRGIEPRVPDPVFAEGRADSQKAFDDGRAQFSTGKYGDARESFTSALSGAKSARDTGIIQRWISSCSPDPLITPRAFDNKLRDLLLLARLDDLINSRVQVSNKEAYEEFRRQRHTRKFDWVKLSAPEELSQKVEAEITEEEKKAHFEKNKASYATETRLRFKYLTVSIDGFLEEVAAEVKEEDLQSDYEADRGFYRRPGILSDEGIFQLFTADELKAREERAYKPYEEVKDQVRERYIRKLASTRVREFSNKLESRIYPGKAAGEKVLKPDEPQVSFEELDKEFKYVKAGEAPYSTQADAEEVFEAVDKGLYSERNKARIDSWYRAANSAGRQPGGNYAISKNQKSELKNALRLQEQLEGSETRINTSFTFFSEVEVKGPGERTYEEALEDVATDVRNQKVVELLSEACTRKVEELEAALKDAPEGKARETGDELFAALAGSELEVTLGENKFKTTLGDEEDSGGAFIPRRGSIMVPGEEDDDGEVTDEDHPSSQALVQAGFEISEERELTVVSDSKESACFILRFSSRQNPDPADFDSSRPRIVQGLKMQGEDLAFASWLNNLYFAAGDGDRDNVYSPHDNCPTVPNGDQVDTDGDGVGDACSSSAAGAEAAIEG